MSEPTTTRKSLRRAICRRARMPFYLSYPLCYEKVTAAADTDTTAADTSIVYCNNLRQKDGHWVNYWFYLLDSSTTAAAGEERRVVGFDARSNGIQPEWPLSAAPATSDEFELLSIWPAHQIHEEIDNVIREAWRSFPDIEVNEDLIIQEDKLEYSCTDFSPTVAYILTISAERSETRYTGYVSNDDTTLAGYDSDAAKFTATDVSLETTDMSSDYRWSFYYGTGTGQSGELAVGSSSEEDVFVIASSSDMSTKGDTTTKYCIWEHTEETRTWYPITAVNFDEIEWPNCFYLCEDYSNVRGLRLKVKYVSGNATLDADSDETQVPRYYILNKALAYLHDSVVGDNRRDRTKHAGLAEYYDQLAERYAATYRPRRPPATIWEEDPQADASRDIADPLGWG